MKKGIIGDQNSRPVGRFSASWIQPLWKPIETAPNNIGILIARSTGVVESVSAKDNDYTWTPYVADGLDRPTHWMPLPAAPA